MSAVLKGALQPKSSNARAFGPQHVRLIAGRLAKIELDIYLVANMASLIAPTSESDIQMRTVLGHMEDLLLKAANDLSEALAADERPNEVDHV